MNTCAFGCSVWNYWGHQIIRKAVTVLVGLEENSAVGLHAPASDRQLPAWSQRLSQAIYSNTVMALMRFSVSSESSLFIVVVRNLLLCPPWPWGERKSWVFLLFTEPFYVFEICYCAFSSLGWTILRALNSSAPAALAQQSNEHWNKGLMYNNHCLWHERGREGQNWNWNETPGCAIPL